MEETLAGRAGRIKAYSVAISVLDRDDTFDPQTDPMVRIEASQLRRRLERYYLTQGVNDPVIIDLPKGGYVPVFRAAAGLDCPPIRILHQAMPSPPGGFPPLSWVWRHSWRFPLIALALPDTRPGKSRTSVRRQSEPHHPGSPLLGRHHDDRSAAIAAGLADEVTQVLTRTAIWACWHRPKDVAGHAQPCRYAPDRKRAIECRGDPPDRKPDGCAYGHVRLDRDV